MFREARIGTRRSIALWWLLAAATVIALLIAKAAGAVQSSPAQSSAEKENNADDEEESPVYKTDAEWKKLLTRKQYRVARLGETEPPFKGKYWKTKTPGTYRCVCCGAALFSSEAKFESGTGWPSFWTPVKEKRLQPRSDWSDGTLRIEVLCTRCGAHMGMSFPTDRLLPVCASASTPRR